MRPPQTPQKIRPSMGTSWGAEAVRRFEEDLLAGRLPVTVEDVKRELGGRDLAC